MTKTIGSRLEELHEGRFLLAAPILAAVLALLALLYITPLADGIVFGIFFFFVTRPVKRYLDRYTRYSPYIATFCILLPLIAIVVYGVFGVWNEAMWIIGHSGELGGMAIQAVDGLDLPAGLADSVDSVLAGLYGHAMAFVASIPVGTAVSRLVALAMNALISLFVCFYLLKDGGTFIEALRGLAPARHRPVLDAFLAEADRILTGIYTGTFYTALYVALGAFIVFVVFGIPYKALLTAFVFIAAMVPILSGMMVFIPVAIYMYIARSPLVAVLFLAVAVVFVYLPPDFLIRPYLIRRASGLHPLLVILAFIGGGVAGGLSGFFAAPLVVGLATAMYRTYKKTKAGDEGLP